MRAAALLGLGEGNWAVENMVIGEALALDDTETKRLQVVLSHTGDGAARFQVFSAATGDGTVRIFVAAACLRLIAPCRRIRMSPIQVDFEALKRDADELGAESFYADYQTAGTGFWRPFSRGKTGLEPCRQSIGID